LENTDKLEIGSASGGGGEEFMVESELVNTHCLPFCFFLSLHPYLLHFSSSLKKVSSVPTEFGRKSRA